MVLIDFCDDDDDDDADSDGTFVVRIGRLQLVEMIKLPSSQPLVLIWSFFLAFFDGGRVRSSWSSAATGAF